MPVGVNAVYAEYRKHAGGVVIHVDNSSRPAGGVLIDGNPFTATANDAALKVGQSLVNLRGSGTADDLRVQVTSISGNAAVAAVLNPMALGTLSLKTARAGSALAACMARLA